jgi:hypothetical protein
MARTRILLFVLALAAGFPAAAASPLVQKLQQVEHDGGRLFKILMDNLQEVDDAGAQEVVEWLVPRRFKADAPYLYALGFYSSRQAAPSRKIEGLEYFAKAALIYRVDTGRCGDATENRAVPVFENAIGMSVVRDGLKKTPELRTRVIENALAFEKANAKRPAPSWICGAGGMARKPPSEKEFQAFRGDMRKQFAVNF